MRTLAGILEEEESSTRRGWVWLACTSWHYHCKQNEKSPWLHAIEFEHLRASKSRHNHFDKMRLIAFKPAF